MNHDSNGARPRRLTTEFGIPVPDNQNSLTAGEAGPVLLQDHVLIEKLAHFNRERIPERVVHAKGAGAHGFFEATADMREFTRLGIVGEVGKRTPLFARFSTVAGEKGSADSARDPRGFALKFYTEAGVYDLVGNNTPIFFIRDPLKFPDFIHSQKRDPLTNLRDPEMMWDFWSLSPESLHQVTWLFGDRGTPRTYRHMDGFSSHAYAWVNAAGKRHWVKYHFKTEQGIECNTAAAADQVAGEDPDFHTRDLFESIDRGEASVWRVYVQIMPEQDAAGYRFNPFDLTKVWPHGDYPRIEIGRMVLDRNPQNYFAEVEQAAFSPANMVPGVEPSPDKMLQGRLFAYADAHRYRLTANYATLPINAAKCPVHHYGRDGSMRFDGNFGGAPNYEPNSKGGPVEDRREVEAPMPLTGTTVRAATASHHEDDDYVQAGDLYRVMDPAARGRLIDNLVGHMRDVSPEILDRQIAHFGAADAEYGRRVADGLGRPFSARAAAA